MSDTKLKLQAIERLGIIRMLNKLHALKGLNIMELKRSGEIILKCEMNAKEKKELQWVDAPNGGANLNLEKALKLIKEIEFTGEEVKIIKDTILGMNTAKGFGNSDMFVVRLCELLKLDIPTK